MVAAVEKGLIAEDAGLNVSGPSLVKVSAPVGTLADASFTPTNAPRVSRPQGEDVPSAFLAIFNREEVVKMWLSPQGVHLTLSKGAEGDFILRSIDTRSELKNVATQLTFDQKPSIAISPDGRNFLVSTGDLVAEYGIEGDGRLSTRPVYQAPAGREVLGARYRGDQVIVTSRRPDLAPVLAARLNSANPDASISQTVLAA